MNRSTGARRAAAIAVAALVLATSSGPAAEPARRPLALAFYYTWYGHPALAAKRWKTWDRKTAADDPLPARDPHEILFAPAIRQVTSAAYPLIGAYDSMSREVVRWHIRLAKAAGLDGFLVDWWGSATWQQPRGWTFDVFEKVVLPVAEEEGFKVALFDETPQFLDDLPEVRRQTIRALKTYARSPAWLRINDEPVWAIYQLWKGRLTAAQGRALIEDVERETGPVYWIVDRMLAQPAAGPTGIELFTPEPWLAVPGIDCFMGYAMFSTWQVHTYEGLAPLYRRWANQVHRARKQVMVPVHPGHDNRKINAKPYVIPRRDGATLKEFWRAATDAGTDLIGLTSFNEWPETTAIEPALTWRDPYRYLRLVGELQGTTFAAPPLPPPEAIDPAMAAYLADSAPPG